MPDERNDDDPRPQPPERPLPEDCCGSGCDRCVLELYEEALDRYRAQLATWERRAGQRTANADEGRAIAMERTVEPIDELVEAARRARERAYAPYSRFRVGAAVRSADGRVFAGCNIENASYGLSVCAERVAIFNAIAHGARELRAIAVCTDPPEPATPCGACRQVIAEFAPDIPIALASTSGALVITSIGELLPRPFRLDADACKREG
jgi:cytidine deaminase